MWYAHQKNKGLHVDIFKCRPSVDKFNEVANSVEWIRENHICDLKEDMWLVLGGEPFNQSIIQEISSFPLKSGGGNV